MNTIRSSAPSMSALALLALGVLLIPFAGCDSTPRTDPADMPAEPVVDPGPQKPPFIPDPGVLGRTRWEVVSLIGNVSPNQDEIEIQIDPNGDVTTIVRRLDDSVGLDRQRCRVTGNTIEMMNDLGYVTRSTFEMRGDELYVDTPRARVAMRKALWQNRIDVAAIEAERPLARASAGAGGPLSGTRWRIGVAVGNIRDGQTGGTVEFGADGWLVAHITRFDGETTVIRRRYQVRDRQLRLIDELGQAADGSFSIDADRMTLDVPNARIVLYREP